MTGGAIHAQKINQNMAKVAKQFNLGMGLGSCRPLLEDQSHFSDFHMRPFIGDRPLYANLGFAQVNELHREGKLSKIVTLLDSLEATGLIIHINPMQEFAQPEGDAWHIAPFKVLEEVINSIDYPIMIKEVGQGFGRRSLSKLLKMNIQAIEFGALGGTNFTLLEQTRHDAMHSARKDLILEFANVGQSAEIMLEDINALAKEEINCREIIISGGMNNTLKAHSMLLRSKLPALVGQASQVLKYALLGEKELASFIEIQIEGMLMAKEFLYLREDEWKV
jgi:isopentenyl-diphosphate delta-isomerase